MSDLSYTDLDDRHFTELLTRHAPEPAVPHDAPPAAEPATPDPPADDPPGDPDGEGGGGDDEGHVLVVEMSVQGCEHQRYEVTRYLTAPVTPAALVDAVRGCSAGILAQLNIDPRSHGGPWANACSHDSGARPDPERGR